MIAVVLAGGAGMFIYNQRERERLETESNQRLEAARVEAAKQKVEAEEKGRRDAEEAAARQRIEAENAAQRREQAERLQATRNPGSVLSASDFKFFDKGILNSYRQLISLSVLNRSKFPLQGLSGQVEWLAEDGTFIGASPFTLSGSIPSGDTKVFSTQDGTLTTGTIQGAARRVRLKFAPAEIVQ